MKSLHSWITHKRDWLKASSIKEGLDLMHCGIVMYQNNGFILLMNETMSDLCSELLGHSLQNGKNLWNALRNETILPHACVIQNGEKPVVRLKDGRTWRFQRSSTKYFDKEIWEMRADDISHITSLNRQLSEENKRIQEQGEHLRAYAQNVSELVRQQELLERKIAVHNDLGALLTETRAIIRQSNTDIDTCSLSSANVSKIWDRWKINAKLLLEKAPGDPQDVPGQLKEAAQSLGIHIHASGVIPNEGRAGELLLAVCAEALVNTFKHARGTNLYLQGTEDAGFYKVILTNDGNKPTSPIKEGGGLGSLRERIQNAGGSMQIQSEPHFALILTLSTHHQPHTPITSSEI